MLWVLRKVGEEGEFMRFRSSADIGNIIDLKLSTIGRGQMGVGTVHHIAWRASDDADQLDWKEHVSTLWVWCNSCTRPKLF